MNRKLEDFVRENREAFDRDEPGPELWQKLEASLPRPAGRTRRLNLSWTAAALLVAAIAGLAYWLGKKEASVPPQPIVRETIRPASAAPDSIRPVQVNRAEQVATVPAAPPKTRQPEKPVYLVFERRVRQQLAALRLKRPEMDGMTGYFDDNFRQLDSGYQNLKNRLLKNPGNPQLLAALQKHLQWQSELLEQQLTVIQQIQKHKNAKYEQATESL